MGEQEELRSEGEIKTALNKNVLWELGGMGLGIWIDIRLENENNLKYVLLYYSTLVKKEAMRS